MEMSGSYWAVGIRYIRVRFDSVDSGEPVEFRRSDRMRNINFA